MTTGGWSKPFAGTSREPPGRDARPILSVIILDSCPKALQGELKARLRLLFDSPDLVTARKLLNDVLADFSERAPRAMSCLECISKVQSLGYCCSSCNCHNGCYGIVYPFSLVATNV